MIQVLLERHPFQINRVSLFQVLLELDFVLLQSLALKVFPLSEVLLELKLGDKVSVASQTLVVVRVDTMECVSALATNHLLQCNWISFFLDRQWVCFHSTNPHLVKIINQSIDGLDHCCNCERAAAMGES
jgi:hypothetical protein